MEAMTWTAQNGKEICVKVSGGAYAISIDGKWQGSTGVFSPVSGKIAAQARAAGIVCFLGPIGLTQERRNALEALSAAEKARIQAEAASVAGLLRLEAALEAAEDAVRNMAENPALAYAARDKAQAALAAWKATHPAAWQAEIESRRRLAAVARANRTPAGEGQDD